jgi:LPXTG-motif cell wall-anchored protein
VIRRMLVLSAMVLATLTATAMLATSAGAQYVPGTPGIIVNPSCSAVGGTITVEGSGFPDSATVTIQVNGATLGTTTSNDEGDFLTSALALPAGLTSGTYTLHAVSGSTDLTSVLNIAVGPCAVAAANVTNSTAATLPVTGTNSGDWVKAGLSLLAIGGLLVLATRRRRSLV